MSHSTSIDPESADTLAYTLKGRASASDVEDTQDMLVYPAGSRPHRLASSDAPVLSPDESTPMPDEEVGYISVKLPPEVSRKLSAIADRRGSKRTHVALEVLAQPLRDFAAQHRAGSFPALPKIVSGSVRSSIAFVLPPDLAIDLAYILATRRAVKAQVVVRMLVPAIEHLHAREFENV